jgi:hypothetical protein
MLKTEDLMLGRQLPAKVAVCPACGAPLLACLPYNYERINDAYDPSAIEFKCVRNLTHRSTVDPSAFVGLIEKISSTVSDNSGELHDAADFKSK